MSLTVLWDGRTVGRLHLAAENSREYWFEYTDTSRPLSLSLPTAKRHFSPAESRPFFEALLPEGTIREQIAAELKLATSDSYGLLQALGRDCAGAIQVYDAERMTEPPSVAWLSDDELDELIRELPRRPLGVQPDDERRRLSLAGVQRKAVLVGDADGGFGEPLNGKPTTHILKPQPSHGEFPSIAVNEYFCMRLAALCGLPAAAVDLLDLAGQPCLVVTRFDRDTSATPIRRLHQEDLCQALGITPDFKYQQPGWRLPSFKSLADLLDRDGSQPGRDRLAVADAAVFNFLIGNADAHAKNVSLLHEEGGAVRLAPLYDLVSTAVYPDLNRSLALGIGDTFDPEAIGMVEWMDFAYDLGLNATQFARRRAVLTRRVVDDAGTLVREARADGWHDLVLDAIVATIEQRAESASVN